MAHSPAARPNPDHMTVELKDQFTFPIYFDLAATFLYALSGALVAIRRRYDVVGLFVWRWLAAWAAV